MKALFIPVEGAVLAKSVTKSPTYKQIGKFVEGYVESFGLLIDNPDDPHKPIAATMYVNETSGLDMRDVNTVATALVIRAAQLMKTRARQVIRGPVVLTYKEPKTVCVQVWHARKPRFTLDGMTLVQTREQLEAEWVQVANLEYRLSRERAMERAFVDTQNLEQSWSPKGLRSTSVGDLIVIEGKTKNEVWVVAPIGFSKVRKI